MKNAVYCIAKDITQAETIVDLLRVAGFASNDISVLLPDKSGTRDFAHEQNTKMPEGAATGGVTGMGAGAILGWLVGIGTLGNSWGRTVYRGRPYHGGPGRRSCWRRRRRDHRRRW